jgi:hypothetical protein
MLFEHLSKLSPFWTIGGESHGVFRAFPHLRAENPQLDSMALGEQHADSQTIELMRRCFLALLKNRDGIPFLSLPPSQRPSNIYLLEKTPRNALNIPFLLKVFPNAKFIYLYRDGRGCVSSLIEAWELGLQTGRFITFRDLPDWHLPGWCFLLPTGWRELRGKSLAEICAFQWAASNLAILDGMSGLDRNRWVSVKYESVIADPKSVLEDVLQNLRVKIGDEISSQMTVSGTTISAPSSNKWKRHEPEINPLLSQLSTVQSKIDETCQER